MAVATYYFDGHLGISAPDGGWSNSADAFNGNDSDGASSSTQGATDFSDNFLQGIGTTANGSGNIVEVRARIRATVGTSINGRIYSSSETLGDVAPFPSGGGLQWGQYSTLTAPTGGWTWSNLKNLTVRLRNATSFSRTVAKVELEVTYNQETKYPGSGTNDASVGTAAWSNPGNIVADDTSYASRQWTSGFPQVSQYLKGTNFDFSSIPDDAVIVGIDLTINCRCAGSPADNVWDNSVRLVKSGTPTGEDKARDVSDKWTVSTFTSRSYGGMSDLWGTTWTVNDIKDSGFGAVMSANVDAPAEIASGAEVDYYTITVYYTLPPAEPTFLKQQNGKLLFQQSGRGILL